MPMGSRASMFRPASASRRVTFASEPGTWPIGTCVASTSRKENFASFKAARVVASSAVRIATLPLVPQVEPLTPVMFTPLAAMASVTRASSPVLFGSSIRNAFMRCLLEVAFRPVRGAELSARGRVGGELLFYRACPIGPTGRAGRELAGGSVVVLEIRPGRDVDAVVLRRRERPPVGRVCLIGQASA